jgi:hypothetical protein
MYEGAHEAVWIRLLLELLGFKQLSPTPIFSNNQAAIQISKNTVFHDRTKHFKVHLHWICEKVESQEFSTHSNLANFLTKSLCKIKHRACVEGMFQNEGGGGC